MMYYKWLCERYTNNKPSRCKSNAKTCVGSITRSELPLEEVTGELLVRQTSARRSESLQRHLFALLAELSELPQSYKEVLPKARRLCRAWDREPWEQRKEALREALESKTSVPPLKPLSSSRVMLFQAISCHVKPVSRPFKHISLSSKCSLRLGLEGLGLPSFHEPAALLFALRHLRGAARQGPGAPLEALLPGLRRERLFAPAGGLQEPAAGGLVALPLLRRASEWQDAGLAGPGEGPKGRPGARGVSQTRELGALRRGEGARQFRQKALMWKRGRLHLIVLDCLDLDQESPKRLKRHGFGAPGSVFESFRGAS